jgi:hypothetical protein
MLGLVLSAAVAAAGASAEVVWRTPYSITFGSADGDDLWLIDTGDWESPHGPALVHIGPAGAARVAELRGAGFSPVADRDHVYVAAGHDLVRVDKRPPHTMLRLLQGEVWPVGVAVDDDSVYLTNQSTIGLSGGPPGGQPGSVARIRKSDGSVTRLATGNARNVVVDGENVYFSSDDTVRAVSRAGGPVRTLVAATGATSALALDGPWLVYTRQGGVSRVHTRDGRVEPLADGIEIPLFVACAGGAVYVGATLVFMGRDEPPKPAEILRVHPGRPAERLWTDAATSRLRLSLMIVAGRRIYFALGPLGGDGATLYRIEVPAEAAR